MKDIVDSKSDLYIIAIGTNDIRYRDSSICAMNPKEYIKEIKKIVNFIPAQEAKIIFISPWFSTEDDYVSKLNHLDKKRLMKQYSLELKSYTKRSQYVYIDPNEYLEKIIIKNKKKYMIDYIHPNNNYGIKLYCQSLFIN